MPEIRIGLAGYGTSGSIFHAPLIASVPRLRLAAVMTSRRDKAAREAPGAHIVSTLDELLNEPGVDLIVVATPTGTHYDVARSALLAGMHVVVDKPITTTVAEADDLIALARDRNRLLSVYQNRRWDSDFLTVRKVIASGVLGAVFSYEAHYDRFRPRMKGGWREQDLPGSGILYDLGSHLVDQALQLFGMPEMMRADVFRQRDDARADDYFHLILGYGRRRVILHGSMFVLDPGPRFAVYGDRGSFVKYGIDPQEDALRGGMRPGDPGWGIEAPENRGMLTLADGSREAVASERGCWEMFYEGIAAALLDGVPPPVDPIDSRNAVAVIVQASSARGWEAPEDVAHPRDPHYQRRQ